MEKDRPYIVGEVGKAVLVDAKAAERARIAARATMVGSVTEVTPVIVALARTMDVRFGATPEGGEAIQLGGRLVTDLIRPIVEPRDVAAFDA